MLCWRSSCIISVSCSKVHRSVFSYVHGVVQYYCNQAKSLVFPHAPLNPYPLAVIHCFPLSPAPGREEKTQVLASLHHNCIISLNLKHQTSKFMAGIKQKYKLLLPIWWWPYDSVFHLEDLVAPHLIFLLASSGHATGEFPAPKALSTSPFVQAAKGQNKARITDSCWRSADWELSLCLPRAVTGHPRQAQKHFQDSERHSHETSWVRIKAVWPLASSGDPLHFSALTQTLPVFLGLLWESRVETHVGLVQCLT